MSGLIFFLQSISVLSIREISGLVALQVSLRCSKQERIGKRNRLMDSRSPIKMAILSFTVLHRSEYRQLKAGRSGKGHLSLPEVKKAEGPLSIPCHYAEQMEHGGMGCLISTSMSI